MTAPVRSKDYEQLFESLKKRVSASQAEAVRTVNKELILLYHAIGSEILTQQAKYGWGAKVIDRLSRDMSNAFPEMKGFSPRNLKYMRTFAEFYPDPKFVQAVLAQLSWYHNITLIDKVKDPNERMFYLQQAIEQGWSGRTMLGQIESNLYRRQGKAVTNFKAKLPSPHSDLAHQALKDPYIFDFLSLGKEANERAVETALIAHMEKFLLELGAGFAFVGRQYHLHVGNQDFYIDLLFYHLKLRCFVVIELKAGDFTPEYAGKMNFYLSAVDDLVKHPTDNPSIGLILCRSKNEVLAEYTLRDMTKAIGLAEYRLTEALPENLKTNLPTIEELEAELEKNTKELDKKTNQE